MPTVWVTNNSRHSFKSAEAFGDIRYLTKGIIDKTNVAHMSRLIHEKLERSSPHDYILPTSLSILSAIAVAEFINQHGLVNLLIHDSRKGRYIERTLVYDNKS